MNFDTITTDDDISVRVAHNTPDNPRGTFFILTGRTEYIEKYIPISKLLNDQGFATLALDWRGQGLSGRLAVDVRLGHVDQFSDYQRDLDAVMALAEAQNLPRPYYMLAHSMGGCIGLRRLMTHSDFAGAIFSAPMWGIHYSFGLNAIAKTIACAMDTLGMSLSYAPGTSARSYVFDTKFEDNKLTNYRPAWDKLAQDLRDNPSLEIGGPSWHWLCQAERDMIDLAQKPSPNIPAVCLLGTKEEIVSPDRIRARMANWTDGTLKVIENGRHETLMEHPDEVKQTLQECLISLNISLR